MQATAGAVKCNYRSAGYIFEEIRQPSRRVVPRVEREAMAELRPVEELELIGGPAVCHEICDGGGDLALDVRGVVHEQYERVHLQDPLRRKCTGHSESSGVPLTAAECLDFRNRIAGIYWK